jgi:aryl-alcohol dehydrogenase-like predicted oxidoreductase
MDYKKYTHSKLKVSTLGFGGFTLGNISQGKIMSEQEGIKLVKSAFDAGINFFDTAPNYALGMSETIIGKALSEVREHVLINTKFGHHTDNRIDFSSDLIEPSILSSLKRLQTTYLDSILLHNPPMDILRGKTEHFTILENLKQKGLIRAYGVSIDTYEELDTVLTCLNVDVIELLFNIFAQSSRALFHLVKEKNISLVIKVPLDSGWLTGKYTQADRFQDIRIRWDHQTKNKRHELVTKLFSLTEDKHLSKYALGFIWSYPEVTTVIPGIKTQEQLNDHLNSWTFNFPLKLKDTFENFYDENIKDDPLPW